jgi:hypothetical protein
LCTNPCTKPVPDLRFSVLSTCAIRAHSSLYLALVIAALGFFLHSLGFAVILALSLAAFRYFLLQAPVWCCAVTRKGELCRKNSHGLLLGCSIRQHKWQRTWQTFTPTGGRAVLAAGRSASGFLVLVGGL